MIVINQLCLSFCEAPRRSTSSLAVIRASALYLAN
jgi:hypothetical protein